LERELSDDGQQVDIDMDSLSLSGLETPESDADFV
jgi:hypothetical protein